jgi:hypothetical protein
MREIWRFHLGGLGRAEEYYVRYEQAPQMISRTVLETLSLRIIRPARRCP